MPRLPLEDVGRRVITPALLRGIDGATGRPASGGRLARRVGCVQRYAFVNVCTKSVPSTAQGRSQPFLADPPEVVLYTVDERDGDLVPVRLHILRAARDIPLMPGQAEIRGHAHDDGASLVTKVAARPAEQGDDVGLRARAAAAPARRRTAAPALRRTAAPARRRTAGPARTGAAVCRVRHVRPPRP